MNNAFNTNAITGATSPEFYDAPADANTSATLTRAQDAAPAHNMADQGPPVLFAATAVRVQTGDIVSEDVSHEEIHINDYSD